MRIMNSHLLTAVAALLSFAQAPPDRQSRVDEIFKEFAARFAGLRGRCLPDGSIVLSRAYGMANLDHDVPLTPSSVFHVASVSKQFTAAAILLLPRTASCRSTTRSGSMSRSCRTSGKRITIRQLLHHTSGIRDQWSLLGLAGWRYSRDLITDDDVLRAPVPAEGPQFHAGRAASLFQQRLHTPGRDRQPRQR